jgi:hypothetical protein
VAYDYLAFSHGMEPRRSATARRPGEVRAAAGGSAMTNVPPSLPQAEVPAPAELDDGFTFGDVSESDVLDPKHGFGDLNDPTVGGRLTDIVPPQDRE